MSSNSGSNDDESDRDSIANALSPRDGYFSGSTSRPQDVMVPDPSQSNTPARKEQEALEELEASRAEASPLQASASQAELSGTSSQQPAATFQPSNQSSPTSPTRRNLEYPSRRPADESTPLISNAPPAYYPPLPGSPYHAQHNRSISQTSNGGYDTMGRRSDTFFPDRDPEDLGGEQQPLIREDDDQDGWGSRTKNWIRKNTDKIFKYIILALAFIVAVGFIWDLVVGIKSGRKSPSNPIPEPPYDGNQGLCHSVEHSALDFHFFGLQEFSLLQLVNDVPKEGQSDSVPVRMTGEFNIVPAPFLSDEDILVDARFYYSTRHLIRYTNFEKNADSLGIYSSSQIPSYNLGGISPPCMYINATIYIKPGVKLKAVNLQAHTMAITVHPGVDLETDNFVMRSVFGSVTSIPTASGQTTISSRHVEVITDYAAIRGTFPLYDSLVFKSNSGSVTADLDLKNKSSHGPAEALLRVDVGSGAITMKTPALDKAVKENNTSRYIPDRDYHSDIGSLTGRVTADLLYSSRTSIKTSSGSINAALTPYGDPRRNSDLLFESSSGSMDVTVRDSISHPGVPLRRMWGRYMYSTGSLTARYPAEWEGTMSGKLLSGSFNIDWPGLEITRKDSDGGKGKWDYYRIEAYKGHGVGSITFDGVSGSAYLMGRGGKSYPRLAAGGEELKNHELQDSEPETPLVRRPGGMPDILVPIGSGVLHSIGDVALGVEAVAEHLLIS